MHHPSTYRAPSRRRLPSLLLAGGLCLALMTLLAACGASSASGSVQDFPTATDIPATPGTAQLNGCPEQQAPTTATTADVVVQGSVGTTPSDAQSVTVKTGQTLEIDLPATFRWALILTDDNSVLTAPASNGWFDATGKGCVWQFTATKAGSATLDFAGGQVCSSASKCTNIATEQSYNLTAS